MKKIGLLTSSHFPDLIPDERPLIEEFKRNRFKVEPLIWDAKHNWDEYDHLIIRNTWDYFSKYEKFLRTLKDIQDSQSLLLNPYETMLWNLDKTYMEELMLSGVPTIPTFKISHFNEERLHEILMLLKTDEFVIKPVVGASGHDTYKKSVSMSTEEKAFLIERLGGRDIIIQPFMPSVQTDGEYSFVFFNQKFSHAVKKIPKTGEFRIQEEHGGRAEAYRPHHREVEEIIPLLKAVKHEHFYARVDVVKDQKGKYVIMEVELVEPQLFFTWGSNSASLFVTEFVKTYGR